MGLKLDTLELGTLFAAAGCHAPADGKPWHMLRPTYASHFIMAGGSLFVLQRLLGHSSPMVTQRYAHLAPDFMASEVAKMSFAAPASASVTDMRQERRQRAEAV
jgi:site-specific recombinase XerD